jgi:hypothetical protein
MVRALVGIIVFYGWAAVAGLAAFLITKGRSARVRVVATGAAVLVPALLTTALILWVFHVGDR